jgi:hypothetical protein
MARTCRLRRDEPLFPGPRPLVCDGRRHHGAHFALPAASNILIFSISYWVIDPPSVIESEGAHQPWVPLQAAGKRLAAVRIVGIK